MQDLCGSGAFGTFGVGDYGPASCWSVQQSKKGHGAWQARTYYMTVADKRNILPSEHVLAVVLSHHGLTLDCMIDHSQIDSLDED